MFVDRVVLVFLVGVDIVVVVIDIILYVDFELCVK